MYHHDAPSRILSYQLSGPYEPPCPPTDCVVEPPQSVRIASLYLTPVMEKLASERVTLFGLKLWRMYSDSFLRRAEAEYRAFLRECRLQPTKRLAPSKAADVVWHQHILFSHDYTAFCQQYFGHYLHHQPTKTVTKTGSGCEGGCERGLCDSHCVKRP